LRLALLVLTLGLACAHALARDAATVFARAQGSVVTVFTPTAAGTGFLIQNGRYLVTCFHVVQGATLRASAPAARG
jgi:S1-C subfamily serine protease